MKRSGESGNPYLIPLPLLKKSVASPLMRTTKEEEVIHDMIQLAKCNPNPIFRRINLRRSQSKQL
jgi:hypothetical protein